MVRGVWLAVLVSACGGATPPPIATCPTGSRDDPVPDESAPRRVSGEFDIKPSDQTKVAMVRKKITRIGALVNVCVSEKGRVSSVCFVERSGFDEWDDRIHDAVWKWRFRPSAVDGKPVAACTEVALVYRQW